MVGGVGTYKGCASPMVDVEGYIFDLVTDNNIKHE